jgi:spermidine synthase
LCFALLAGYGAFRSLRTQPEPVKKSSQAAVFPPGVGVRVVWLALSACTSIMLLATTSQLTQEVAVIPFLWVLPLTLYLLTFIVAFSGGRWYSRQVFLFVFIGATVLFGNALARSSQLDVISQIMFLSVGLFTTCLVLHAELYRRRPQENYLASFYLYIAVGGAMGGICVTLIAPAIFKGYWELPLGFALSWILFAFIHVFDKIRVTGTGMRFLNSALILYGVIFAAILVYQYIRADLSNSIFIERNFYGVVRVKKTQVGEAGQDAIQMTHGVTVHGVQFVAAQLRDQPTTYYTEHSGIGLGILHHPHCGQGMRVGVLGLGIGTLAAYGQPGDVYRFYEINPMVIELANGDGGYFTFLKDSPASVEIVPGDARLSLERELTDGTRQNFDLLALDTFDSDSIPVHLIDEQAFEIYLQHLTLDGILAVHVSNRHFDFVPVVWKLAQYFKLRMVLVQSPENDPGGLSSTWVLLSRDEFPLGDPQIEQYAVRLDDYTADIRLWTDDYSNPLQILR